MNKDIAGLDIPVYQVAQMHQTQRQAEADRQLQEALDTGHRRTNDARQQHKGKRGVNQRKSPVVLRGGDRTDSPVVAQVLPQGKLITQQARCVGLFFIAHGGGDNKRPAGAGQAGIQPAEAPLLAQRGKNDIFFKHKSPPFG
ncbi:hypothetical protein A8O28_09820 [Enterobacteriaceae bacterium CCUG 67584]|nr:hypothetical protein [Enterobacteriaceae bacterium CCUG 67584]